jgi:glycosyltransferase involved in cell wall biosynthesis
MEIHQLLPGMHPGDAISNYALVLRDLMRSWGHSSEIFAKDLAGEFQGDCRRSRDFCTGSDSLTIYHYSLGCEELTQQYLTHRGKRALIYHNITPHHLVAHYNRDLAAACAAGRRSLANLRPATHLAMGDSPYNCRELADHGFRDPRVLPLLIDLAGLVGTEPCPRILRRFSDGWTHFLFVGRISPHKRQDDLLRVFAEYQCRIDPRSRLVLVGSWRFMENYLSDLRNLAHELAIEDHVFFTGHVPPNELAAYYRVADLFLCMSEHEGLCVPLLEAMVHDVPIIAYAAAAVPDTLGKAGLLIGRKDYPVLAELAHLVIEDQDLRRRILHHQRRRLADFRPEPIVQRFRSYLDELIQA